MKKTLAKKLTVKLALLLVAVLLILLFSSYYVVSHIVRDESASYNNAVSGILADTLTNEANGMHLPINESYTEIAASYGDYICEWYNVDYAYTYIYTFDGEKGTVTLLSFSQNKRSKEDASYFYSILGKKTDYTPVENELALWKGELTYTETESKHFKRAMESLTASEDNYGNKVVSGVGIFLNETDKTTAKNFKPVVLVLLVSFIAMTTAIYFIIRRSVFKPAQKISESMAAFITDGKRTNLRLDESGDGEFAMIASSFNTMTDNIDSYLEHINKLTGAQERQKAELDIASKIQKGFLVPGRLKCGDYEIFATMTPAKNIGGDLYDYLQLDDGRILLTVADVSGKGISASMYMAVTLVLMRQFAKMGCSPGEILKNTNDTISEHNPSLLFITVFAGIYDTKTGILTYSNAGHNPPYLLRNKPELLNGAKNLLLGLYPGEEYSEEKIKLCPGDTLFLYTDGVNEATNEKKSFFGEERLMNTLTAFSDNHGNDPLEYVNEALHKFSGDAEQSDDITMLSFTVKKSISVNLVPNETEFSRIKDIILSSELPRATQLSLCVAAEELFVNICSYAYEGKDTEGEKVSFTFERSDRILMRFEDGGIRYDPTENVIECDEYDPDEQIGGLGKLIAFSIADSVKYEYRDNKNILTMIKFIKEENP